jgi:hypothetical protein
MVPDGFAGARRPPNQRSAAPFMVNSHAENPHPLGRMFSRPQRTQCRRRPREGAGATWRYWVS